MKYTTQLLGLFSIMIAFASCTSEQENRAAIVTDNYVHFVDSVANLNPDAAQANWNTIHKFYEKTTTELNIEIDKLEDSRDFDAKIDLTTAKYEAYKNSILQKKLKLQNNTKK